MTFEKITFCMVFLISSMFCIIDATDCALFKAHNKYAYKTSQSTYAELPGLYDVGEYFDLSYDVLPSALSTEGAMFSMGTRRDFKYYDQYHPTDMFLATEFSHQSFVLLLKTNSSFFHHEQCLSKTYPEPYTILDQQWHHIRVFHNPMVDPATWNIQIDDVTPSVEVEAGVALTNNVTITGKEAFIGGRPGYTAFQFQGIIKNVRLNGSNIPLSYSRTNGRVEIVDCDSRATKRFLRELLQDYRFMRP